MSLTTDSSRRFTLPVAKIDDSNRLRQDYSHVDELADSLKEHGLLQPIVVSISPSLDTGKHKLIAGGSRLRAARQLGWTEIPITYFELADEVTLRILEVEENVRRKAMTWQERVLGIAEVHNRQFVSKVRKGETWTQSATGELLGMSSANISYALTLADYIRKGDKEINGCKVMWDAINLLVKRQTEESNRLLAKMTVPTVSVEHAKQMMADAAADDSSIFTSLSDTPASGGVAALADDGEMPGEAAFDAPTITIPLSKMLIRGDSVEVCKQLPAESIDHVITDWPYGIDMDNIQQAGTGQDISSTAAEHTVEGNEALHSAIIPELYRILKPGGFFITFTDLMQWQRNYDLAIAAGFKVQRWALIWHKTHRCMNQMALYNFTKDYEIAIVCRKGNATLLTPQASSIFVGATDEATRAFNHPFAKPRALWQWVFQAVAFKGQTVLDPFAGVGSSTLAAIEYGLQPLAIEVNEKFHAACVVNVSEHYRRNLKNVKFL